MGEHTRRPLLSRRRFLGLSGAGTGILALGGCGAFSAADQGTLPKPPRATKTGNVKSYDLEVAPAEFDLNGGKVQSWTYNGGMPGPEIRVKEGDTLRVKVDNRLPEGTSVHWHGLPIANGMDGVPDVTQQPIQSGEQFVYEFVVPVAGTYMYHSHSGLQLDRALHGPLIVEPKKEDLSYDREQTLIFDDWIDGISGQTPEDALDKLQSGGGMGDMGGMMSGDGGSGKLEYPLYLVNGRAPDDPETLAVRRGEKLRLRLINPASETSFRFAVGGHRLTVTHADGLPVEHVTVDAVSVGMGERYDVLVEADNPGVWQAAAAAEGKNGLARAVLRYEESGESSTPAADLVPQEMDGRLLSYDLLRTADRESFPAGDPDRTLELVLAGGHGNYVWAINDQIYPDADPLEIRKGEWVRLNVQNASMIAHPMHLHGHFFQIDNGTGKGPYKDTATVGVHDTLNLDFVANNPGEWLFHCHNLYHLATGMARVISYAD